VLGLHDQKVQISIVVEIRGDNVGGWARLAGQAQLPCSLRPATIAVVLKIDIPTRPRPENIQIPIVVDIQGI
jgi:hypothetical protein